MGLGDIFQKGETVPLISRIIDPQTGDPATPETITITIYGPDKQAVITEEDMLVETGTPGGYYYNFDTFDQDIGVFSFEVKAIRSNRVTIDRDDNNCFTVE